MIPRDAFLAALCGVYAAAFGSIRAQIHGLFGRDGLEPVDALLDRLRRERADVRDAESPLQRIAAYPTLVWLHEPLGCDPCVLMQLLAFAGLTIAVLGVVLPTWRSALPLALLWTCYLSIAQCGQTFMQFQWDAFVLEVGFLSIWLAPWWSQAARYGGPAARDGEPAGFQPFAPPRGVVWGLRFLFFKFMLMSGAVKIQARCPAWLELSALDFHFATQPLPLPLAWYAHQAHPTVNRLAVAFTLLIESPWTLLVLAPHPALRRLSAAMQTLLQIAIALTGNNNFFNLLTVVVACTLLDVEHHDDASIQGGVSAGSQEWSALAWIRKVDRVWRTFQTHRGVSAVVLVAGMAFCVNAWLTVIDVTIRRPPADAASFEAWLEATTVRFLPSVENVQHWLAVILPRVVLFAGVTILAASVRQVVTMVTEWRSSNRHSKCTKSRPASRRVLAIGVLFLVSSSLTSMWVFTSSVMTLSTLDGPFQSSLPPFVASVYLSTARFRVTSAYGLFRRMTGVGTFEIGGQQFSVVARPEIIIEGTDDGGKSWRPFHFRFKPGDVQAPPRLAAPFQPRLDWQMWFAALSDYHSAPWLVHLVDKLLAGSTDAKQLLDASLDPFPLHPPDAIRCHLYYYDFTRLDTSWSRRIPTAGFISPANGSSSPWWTRTFAREFLPVLERGNPSLRAFVDHHWPPQPPSKAPKPPAIVQWLCEANEAPLWAAGALLAAHMAMRDLGGEESKLKLL